MKILQINAVGQSGSTGRTCQEFASFINNHTSHTCYTAFAQGKTGEFCYQIGDRIEWKSHAFLSRLTGKQAHFSRRGTRGLLRYIGQIQPDIVHLRNLHGNYIHFPMLMKFLAENRIPVVLTLHDCWFFTGKCTHYTVDLCDRWISGCHDCPRLKKDNRSWFRDATSELWKEKKTLFSSLSALAVVGVSDWITEEARKSFLSCAKEIIRIYNWIDLDLFSSQNATELSEKLKSGKKHLVLGVASGWSGDKGLYDFMKLAEKLQDTAMIALVGNLPEKEKLPENILSIPSTESVETLVRYYNAADVFVTLSLEETFGKVSAEALACGTPVVCYDSTANGELVGEGCGAVVPPKDLDSAEQAVREILANGKKKYSSGCRVFAENNFEKIERIKDYLYIYKNISNFKLR